MGGISPKRWLGQTAQVTEYLDGIDDLAERGKAITELIDALWHHLLPELGQQRRAVVRRMAVNGLSDAKIGEQIGVNRQRVSQLRRG